MSAPPEPHPEVVPGGRRRRGCFLLALLLASVLAAALVYLTVGADWALRGAVAEADRLDPGWRLEQLEEKRARPPDAENSARQVLAVHKLIPGGWASSPEYEELFRDQPPEAQLNEQQLAALRAELGKAGRASDEGRKLAGMPDGSFDITWLPGVINTSPPGMDEAREVSRLLAEDARLRAQEGDADGAVRSLQASLNAGRSLGDTPVLVAQLVRLSCVAVPAVNVERVLAQGEPSPAVLKDLQRLLEEEDRHPTLLVMLRGERAEEDAFMTFLEAGHLSRPSLAGLVGPGGGFDALLVLYVPGEPKREHAALLHAMTQLVEAAKLPEPEQRGQFEQLEASARRQPIIVRPLLPAVSKVGAATWRGHAMLRCAAVLVAAERYRREQGRWPDSPEALVERGYLGTVPADPYDGRPLRLRRTADGLVVYSVGPDGQDSGGAIDRKMQFGPGTDLGFRLWDPARRRQPPLPPKPAPAPGDEPAKAPAEERP